MGLITETVNIKIGARNKRHYEKLQQKDLKIGTIIEVNVNDLTYTCEIPVICLCDYCNKEYETKYSNYKKSINEIIQKCCCYECRSKKIAESNMIRYGVKSTNSLSEVRNKQITTNIEKYGTKNPFGNKEIQEKIKKTCLKKYGDEHPARTEEIKQKTKETNLIKYGYEYAGQVPEFKEKRRESCVKNLGVEYPVQSEIIKNKIKNTNLIRYNTENAMQNIFVREKQMKTMKERYGVTFPSQSKTIRKKACNTFYNNNTLCTSTQQIYISQLFRMSINYPIVYWNVDMYDPQNDIIWEIDGGGHNLAVKLGDTTQEEFDNKERIREIVIRREGHKICRIISSNDKYPSDKTLLQMLQDAKQYFSDYPEHSWINFDIDNGIFRNAEHKDGSPYFYGQLRRIKKTDLESA